MNYSNGEAVARDVCVSTYVCRLMSLNCRCREPPERDHPRDTLAPCAPSRTLRAAQSPMLLVPSLLLTSVTSLAFFCCFWAWRVYNRTMTKLLEQALEAARTLSPDAQDDIARVVLRLAGTDEEPPVTLSPEERTAIVTSQAAAARGEFATDEQVRAVWGKHGL